MNRWLALALFIVLVLGGGWVIGYFTAPGEWYASLEKPAFNPPNWVFAPVWSLLYVMVAVAGWRVWCSGDGGTVLVVWFVQLALNFLWSPIFFTAQNLGLALAVLVAMLATIVVFIVTAWRVDRPAALLFLPYAAWVSFAGLLNLSLLLLN